MIGRPGEGGITDDGDMYLWRGEITTDDLARACHSPNSKFREFEKQHSGPAAYFTE